MRVYRLKRETTEGDFGFYSAQLYVGELSDPQGNRLKGLSLVVPTKVFEIPVPLQTEGARKLVALIDSVTPEAPQLSFQARISWMWNFRLTLNKHLDNWLGSSGYSGSVFLGYGILGQWFGIKVKAETLKSLRDCLARFYGL